MKLAIVHDFLTQYGGAEKVLEALHEVYPSAPIFTSIYNPDKLPPIFSRMDIRVSPMNGWPGAHSFYRAYFVFYPWAFERMNLEGYDVVLSSSSAYAKGVRLPPGARHVSYCYTPMRFVWQRSAYFSQEGWPAPLRWALTPGLRYLKRWDLSANSRVDAFVAISRAVQERVRHCYNRDAQVIYPPVDTAAFSISPTTDDYYLLVARLAAYKRIDVAVEAFNCLGRPLVIVGRGPQEKLLKRLAGPHVTFLSHRTPLQLAALYGRCRAYVCAGEEDFGISVVEAMAAGRPIVAYGRGGALETVAEGTTGVFFRSQTAESLMEAVRRLDSLVMDPSAIRAHAQTFDKGLFQERMGKLLASFSRS